MNTYSQSNVESHQLIRSYLSPNKPTIVRINSQEVNKSIEPIVNQKPILYSNKTKTIIKSLNLENSLNDFQTQNQTINNQIIVYRLSADKNPNTLQKKSVTNQLVTDVKPLSDINKKRYLVSNKSGKLYKVVDKSVSMVNKTEVTEPDTDLISDEEYFKYLNLIGSKRIKSENKSSLDQWSLRNISKVSTVPKYDNNGAIILDEVCPRPRSSDINNREDNNEVSRRKLAKSQWLTEVRDSSNRFLDPKERIRDDSQRKRDKELKEWKINAENTIAFFGMTSFMGRRLFRSLFCPLNQLQIYLKTCEIEKYCFNSCAQNMSTLSHLYGSNGVTRITRNRDCNEWTRNYQHKYCFNRFQRLEKYRQLETGLSWRSRVLKSKCKRLSVRVTRINNCPICRHAIEFEPRHQCFEFEPHLRPIKTVIKKTSKPTISVVPQQTRNSSDEFIVIGDDFLNEGMESDTEPAETRVSLKNIKIEQQMTKPVVVDEEDDDIMIVEEVFKTKDNNIVLKPLLKSSTDPKTSFGCLKKPSFITLNQRQNNYTVNITPNTRSGEQQRKVIRSIIEVRSHSAPNCSKQQDFVFASHLFK